MRYSDSDIAKFSPRIQQQIRDQYGAAARRVVSEPPAPSGTIRQVQAAPKRQHTPGVMNKTEEAYSRILEMRRIRGEIQWYAFEAITLKLAEKCRYTPDYLVLVVDGSIEIHEVKARTKAGKKLITDDAAVKLRIVRDQFPMFRLVIAWGCRGDFEMECR